MLGKLRDTFYHQREDSTFASSEILRLFVSLETGYWHSLMILLGAVPLCLEKERKAGAKICTKSSVKDVEEVWLIQDCAQEAGQSLHNQQHLTSDQNARFMFVCTAHH